MDVLQHLAVVAIATKLLSLPVHALEPGDLIVYEEAQTLFIDGNGAEIHIDYVGPQLTEPLKVKVEPVDNGLTVKPGQCTFTSEMKSCRQNLTLTDSGSKRYGMQDFTFSEVANVATQARSIKAKAASETAPVTVSMGVQNRAMPKPIRAFLQEGALIGKIVLKNGTRQGRSYQAGLTFWQSKDLNQRAVSRTVNLNPNTSCYLDANVGPAPASVGFELIYVSNQGYVADITDASRPIYNGFRYADFVERGASSTGLAVCSVLGESWCASDKFGSWTVGIGNLGSKADGIVPGRIVMIDNTSWNSEANIPFLSEWARANPNFVLLLVQGSIDGSVFDSTKPGIATTLLELKSVAPCSEYTR